jgi:CubicO group peptidase (beta-lactamase class C family)
MKRTYIFFFCIFLCLNIGHAQSLKIGNRALGQKLDQVMAADFNENGLGGVLLVAKHGMIIYEKAVGKANMELDVPLSTDNVFRIASITKQFTAVAILQLVEKGQLSLDEDVTKFIPEYPAHGYHISVANLLSHTSGIKDYMEIPGLSPDIMQRKNSPEDLISLFKDQPIAFAPGTQFQYSNSNYVLLGYIIEKVSNESYEKYVQEHIFTPLGMNHSYYDSPEKVILNRITGYIQTGANTVMNAQYLDPSSAYAAGGLAMTAKDLFKWHCGLYKYTILKKESLEKAFTPFTLNNGKKTKYGFGWDLDSLEANSAIQHSGSINGFSAFEIYLPAEDVFVTCFSNRMNISTQQPAMLAAMIATGSPAVQDLRLTDEQMTRFTGTYKFKLDQPSTITIFKKNGKLYLYQTGYPHPWEMHFTKPEEFICYEVFPIRHDFSIDDTGKIKGFVIHAPTYTSTITRIK